MCLSPPVSPRKTLFVHTEVSLSPSWTCGLVPWTDFSDHHLAASCSCWETIPALAQCSPKVPGIVVGLIGGFGASCHIQALPDCTQTALYSQTWGLHCAWCHGSCQFWQCPTCHFCFPTETPWALAHCSSRPCPHGFPTVKSLALSFGSPHRAKLLTSPRHLSEPSLTSPPRTQGSLGAVPSPSRNTRNSLNVLPSSKCPTLSLP